MKSVVEDLNSHGFSGGADLESSFDSAMKNEVFSNLVSKLNLPKEKLMKYTSTLEECACNYDCCLKCKGLMHCCFKLEGYCYLPRVIDGRLEFDYKPCKYKTNQLKKTAYMNNIYLFDVPLDVREADIMDKYILRKLQEK